MRDTAWAVLGIYAPGSKVSRQRHLVSFCVVSVLNLGIACG